MTPEFSRPERVETIGERERTVAIAADAGERAALARRFGLVAVERLEAALTLRRDEAGVLVAGRVTGAVVQACAVTDAPLPARIDEPVALRFVADLGADAVDAELPADALDMLPIEDGAIDLGEAAAETLALALDPFPRAPGAEAVLAAAGVLGEEDAGPFGALAALRDRLKR